jgi:LmbE family N-acetylglucosaminyl deacetylase
MRPVVGVFAHPDDEVFAGGALATFAKERDVYLVSITNGEAGINSSSKPQELGDLRQDELRNSAKALGIKDVFFLDFGDGELNNNLYSVVTDKLQEILEKLDPEIILTFEPRGVSGHMDHALTSSMTTYVFEKMPNVRELWYYGFNESERELFKEYFVDFFVYIPRGFKTSEISKTIDTTPVWSKKVKALHQHESQKHDMEKLVEIFEKQKKEEYYLILNKDTV